MNRYILSLFMGMACGGFISIPVVLLVNMYPNVFGIIFCVLPFIGLIVLMAKINRFFGRGEEK